MGGRTGVSRAGGSALPDTELRVRAGSKKKRAESLEASPLPLSAFYSSYGSFLLMHLIFGSVFRQALPASAELRIDWKDTGEKKINKRL